MQYLYRDGDSFHFMDTENYDQLHIDAEVLGDNANYMVAGVPDPGGVLRRASRSASSCR